MGKSPTPENRIKTEVLKYLKLRQIKAWSNPSGAVLADRDRTEIDAAVDVLYFEKYGKKNGKR